MTTLYHGTTALYVPELLADGVLPSVPDYIDEDGIAYVSAVDAANLWIAADFMLEAIEGAGQPKTYDLDTVLRYGAIVVFEGVRDGLDGWEKTHGEKILGGAGITFMPGEWVNGQVVAPSDILVAQRLARFLVRKSAWQRLLSEVTE